MPNSDTLWTQNWVFNESAITTYLAGIDLRGWELLGYAGQRKIHDYRRDGND